LRRRLAPRACLACPTAAGMATRATTPQPLWATRYVLDLREYVLGPRVRTSPPVCWCWSAGLSRSSGSERRRNREALGWRILRRRYGLDFRKYISRPRAHLTAVPLFRCWSAAAAAAACLPACATRRVDHHRLATSHSILRPGTLITGTRHGLSTSRGHRTGTRP
jgi:hypothetical protein